MANIFVIDSYAVYRYGLVSMLKERPEFRVIGDAANTSEAVAKLGELQPDIVIMDIFMPGGEGVEAVNLMRQKFPDVKVIVFTLSDKEEDFLRAMRAGARAYLLKSIETAELIESVHLVATGHAIVSPLMAFRLPEEFGNTNTRNRQGVNSLSLREKEVLCLVAQGASNKEIAAHCYISQTTAKAHLRRILEKLNVRNRAHAAATGISKGLLNQISPPTKDTGGD
ncbi:Oxygen regulatory protein NreC [subsurface metagenome]